jgi:hypothetical protein
VLTLPAGHALVQRFGLAPCLVLLTAMTQNGWQPAECPA